MTPYELWILAFEATNIIDSTFETWMAATFAIIVVGHVAGEKLNIYIKLFIAVLYLACVLLLYIRFQEYVNLVMYFFSELARDDTQSISSMTVKNVGWARHTVFIVGSFGATVFLFVPKLYSKRNAENKDA